MQPIQALFRAKKIAAGAYINPWRNPVRAKIMLNSLFANVGYGCVSFTLNYAMAGEGIGHSLVYQMLRMALMGYLCVPLTFWFLARFKSPRALALIQLAALGFYFIDPSSGFWNAVGITIAFTPFLALNQYRFAKNNSTSNYGNETALNSYLIVIGYSVGLFLGGLLLQHDMYMEAVLGGSVSTIVGAYMLYHPMTAQNNIAKVMGFLSLKRPTPRISFFAGLFNPMVDGCMPVWMRILGISPLGAGINMSLRPLIGVALTPVVGWLIQKKGFRAAQLGGIGMVVGWLLMVGAASFSWMLTLGLGVLSIGSNLLYPMEVGRWMKRRSSAAVISREISIASGRITAYGLGITTAFLLPVAYPLLGLALSGMFILGIRPKRKGLGRAPDKAS